MQNPDDETFNEILKEEIAEGATVVGLGDFVPQTDAEGRSFTTGMTVTDMWPELTDRETEVAYCLARGFTNRELATEMKISIKTVDTHRGNLLKKLKCRNNVELCLLAVKRGAVSP